MVIFLLAIDIIMVVCGQVFIKKGMNEVGSFSSMPFFDFLLKTINSNWVMLGFLLYIFTSIIWVMILSKVNLSYAYPMLSLSYLLILLLSWAYLNEDIYVEQLVGILLICCGVYLINKI